VLRKFQSRGALFPKPSVPEAANEHGCHLSNATLPLFVKAKQTENVKDLAQ